MHIASKCYGLFLDEKIIGFIAIMHFPHPTNKKIKKVHRLVILPDFQGIGIGVKFLESVAHIYKDFDFRITTTLKSLYWSLKKNKKWALTSYGKNAMQSKSSKIKNLTKRNSVNTYTFKFQGATA